VHLSAWPKTDDKKINEKLEKSFEIVLKIIEVGLRERDKAQIGLKWPLAKVTINAPLEITKELEDLLKNQLNVKSILKTNNKEDKIITVELDTKLTPELEAEGYARVVSRLVQAERKKAGLVKTDIINLIINSEKLKPIIKQNEKMIKERTNAKNLTFGVPNKKMHSVKEKIKDKELEISFEKFAK
jgi:isoleucyl-tRNA synthetase